MTTDKLFILFRKSDFNTILAHSGGNMYRWLQGLMVVDSVGKIGGPNFSGADFFLNLGPRPSPAPSHSEENDSPLLGLWVDLSMGDLWAMIDDVTLL